VNTADRSAATVRSAYRIVRSMAGRSANVTIFCSDAIVARDSYRRLYLREGWTERR
jgi:hypothetical protein